METKKHLIAMILALIAMCMGTQVLADEAYAVYDSNGKTLIFYYDANRASRTGEGIETYDLNTGNTRPGWIDFENPKDIQYAQFDKSFKGARPTSTYMWFYGMTNLPKIIGLHYLNTSEVTNMGSMFEKCSSLTELNLSHFDTKNVEGMASIFEKCTNLETIYVGKGWNTDKVPYSNLMFIDCESIKGEKGTTYDATFVRKQLAQVDGGPSNPGYLTARPAGYAVLNGDTLTFYNDGNMPETAYPLNIGDEDPEWNAVRNAINKVVFDSSFAESRPVSTYGWFTDGGELTEIEGMQYLNTSEVTNMEIMFSGCGQLTSIDLNYFDTQKVTNMRCMFISCVSLQSLNLQSFNTSNVTDMTSMFQGCAELVKIYVGTGWNTSNVTESSVMFFRCSKLEGEQGTSYIDNAFETYDCSYAHIDGGESNPGYLSSVKSYNLWIDGVQVTSVNNNNIGGGSFSYDPSANKLTINKSFSSSSSNDIINNAISGLTIYIPTDVTLSSSEEISIIKTSQPLWVTGPGYLTCTCPELGCGIDVSESSSLTITNANLVIQCGYGLSGYFNNTTDESLMVINSNVHINSSECAIGLFKGGISLEGCNITTPENWVVDDNGSIRTDYSYAKEIVITRDSNISTDIDDSLRDSVKGQRDGWYTIDGRKLNGKPTKKGVYINNGKAVVR